MQINDLIAQLDALPGEKHTNFATRIRELNALNFGDGLKHQHLLTSIYSDQLVNLDTRMKAFYAHQVNYWRFSKYEDFRRNVDDYEPLFRVYAHFNNWRAQCYFSYGTDDKLGLALEFVDRALVDLPDLPNILSFKADILVSIQESKEEVDRTELLKARHLVDKAISIPTKKYARHHAIKARIELLLENYGEATKLINIAISIEDTTAADYSIRIGEFNAVKIRIIVQEQKLKAASSSKSIIKEVESTKVQLVELVGILVAVIALIISGVQVSRESTFQTQFSLFLTIGGINLVTFSSYSLVFYKSRVRMAQVLMLVMGLLLLAGAFIIYKSGWQEPLLPILIK